MVPLWQSMHDFFHDEYIVIHKKYPCGPPLPPYASHEVVVLSLEVHLVIFGQYEHVL